MALEKHQVAQVTVEGHRHVFLFTACEDPVCGSPVVPATFDFNAADDLVRVELLYFQYEMRELGKTITLDGPPTQGGFVLEVDPTAVLADLVSTRLTDRRIASHAAGDAYLLLNNVGEFVGVEAILDRSQWFRQGR